jgi:DNA-binding response OmpR family regulator
MMQDSILKEGKILIIDDERANVRFLEIVLEQAGYHNVFSTTDPCQALFLCEELRPDLLLLDLHMPHLDGFALMQILHTEPDYRAMPILVLTADGTVPVRHRALAEGAKDFLLKPLDEVEVLLRIRNLLETHFRHELLEAKIRETQRFMRSTFDALTSHVAVLDQDGKILAANRAWRMSRDTHCGDAESCDVGANYLAICDQAAGIEAEQARAVARGIRQVMGGVAREFHMEYSCHTPVEPCACIVRVTPFDGDGPVRVVVAHDNTTAHNQREEETSIPAQVHRH